MYEKIRRVLEDKAVMAFVSIIFGGILIIKKRSALDGLVKVLGILLLVAAGAFIVMYIKNRGGLQLGGALATGVIGLFLVMKPVTVVNFFPVIIGLVLLLNGLFDLSAALARKKYGEGGYFFSFLFALLTMAAGLMLLLHPGYVANRLVLFAGIVLVINGLFDLLMLWVF